MINPIDLWSVLSLLTMGQLLFQWMQCFMYYEADSYRESISYITKILRSSWEDKAEEKEFG